MDRTRLDDKRRRVAVLLGEAPAEVVARFARSFDVEYAHNSTAIEGNTLSLIQTKVILEDGLSVGGKALREIYEVANHDRAFSYVKRAVAEGRLLDEEMLKDISTRCSWKTSWSVVSIAMWRYASRARDFVRQRRRRCSSRCGGFSRICRASAKN